MTYQIDGRMFTAGELCDYYENLVNTYPILTLEDPFAEEAFEDSAKITAKLGKKVRIIGDDLYVTNPDRIAKGIEMKATNAVLIEAEPDRDGFRNARSNPPRKAPNSRLWFPIDRGRPRTPS